MTNKKHFYISMIKSGIRIIGATAVLLDGSIYWLAGAFLVAEFLGIFEEIFAD